MRQGLDADGLAADLTTPEQRRRYIAAFYSSRFWAHPGAFMGDAPMVFGPNGGTPTIDFHTEPFGDAAKLRASFGGYESVFDPAKQSGPTRLERNEAVRALLLFGPSDHVIYPAFDEMAAVVFPDHDGPHRLDGVRPLRAVGGRRRAGGAHHPVLRRPALELSEAQTLTNAGLPTAADCSAPIARATASPAPIASTRLAAPFTSPGSDELRSAAVRRDHTAPAARASPPRRSATKPSTSGASWRRSWMRSSSRSVPATARRQSAVSSGPTSVSRASRPDDGDGEDRIADLHAEQRVGEVVVRAHAGG